MSEQNEQAPTEVNVEADNAVVNTAPDGGGNDVEAAESEDASSSEE